MSLSMRSTPEREFRDRSGSIVAVHMIEDEERDLPEHLYAILRDGQVMYSRLTIAAVNEIALRLKG
jgi:hypothetical protein